MLWMEAYHSDIPQDLVSLSQYLLICEGSEDAKLFFSYIFVWSLTKV